MSWSFKKCLGWGTEGDERIIILRFAQFSSFPSGKNGIFCPLMTVSCLIGVIFPPLSQCDHYNDPPHHYHHVFRRLRDENPHRIASLHAAFALAHSRFPRAERCVITLEPSSVALPLLPSDPHPEPLLDSSIVTCVASQCLAGFSA